MAKIVVTRPIPDAGLDMLRAEHDVEVYDSQQWSEEDLVDLGDGADALLTLLSDPVTEKTIAALEHLQVIAQFAVGLDNIDLKAAEKHGIVVTHTPGVLTDATADFAFALMLAVCRKVIPADRYVRSGEFSRWETQAFLGTELSGKQLGIIGMGRIGQAVARRALGFGMNVVYHNRSRANPTVEYRLGAKYVGFEELIETSDVISLHCPLNEDSHHLINADALARMKPTCHLVNTARGAVIDEEALVRALQEEEIAGAGLDVFEKEPHVHPELKEMERVVLAPHLGSATVEARNKMARMCAEGILAVLQGADEVPHRAV